jgi:site-specific DNA recombinase
LQSEVTGADERLNRLYKLVEDGLTEVDNVLRHRLDALKSTRDHARAALERAKSHASGAIAIDPALIESFGRLMRQNLTGGSIPFRKAYLQSVVDLIEVDDTQIRINCGKDILEKAVLASRNGSPDSSQMSTRWRARRDSNSRPLDS